MRLPDLACPEPDQLAEHLADLGRGGEVALHPERIARHVIAVGRVPEAQTHVARHRDGTFGGKDRPQRVEQGRHADVASVSAGGRVEPRAASQMARIPTSAIGTDSSIPMVMPPPSAATDEPNRKPSWAIGLAEELAGDARRRVTEHEDAADQAGPAEAEPFAPRRP